MGARWYKGREIYIVRGDSRITATAMFYYLNHRFNDGDFSFQSLLIAITGPADICFETT